MMLVTAELGTAGHLAGICGSGLAVRKATTRSNDAAEGPYNNCG
jgi:hypothetical protein